MLDAKSLPTLNALVDKLMGQLVAKQDELRRAENRAKGWSPQRCNALCKQIEKIEAKLRLAEKLQEQALTR